MPDRVLTPEMTQAIRALLPRYPSKQAVTIPALHIVNDKLRYVPLQAVVEIANLLGLAPAQVQDTLTFYGYFKQDKPHGRCRLWVCRSISCALRGADDLLDHLSQTLHVQPGETTPDGRVSLEWASCLGMCDQGPALLVNDRVYTRVTPDQVHQIIEDCRRVFGAHAAQPVHA